MAAPSNQPSQVSRLVLTAGRERQRRLGKLGVLETHHLTNLLGEAPKNLKKSLDSIQTKKYLFFYWENPHKKKH